MANWLAWKVKIMGKPGAYLSVNRCDHGVRSASNAVADFDDIVVDLPVEAQRVQASRCMNCGVPFCQSGLAFGGAKRQTGCPLHNLIPETNDLLYRGRLGEAGARLSLTNPFPEFTGRVCPAPCETACNLGLGDDSVAIHDNERAISDFLWKQGINPLPPAREGAPLVSVVGSGPAGLAAAWELTRRGARVRVYERDERPGGLLMYGIPNMKLEKSIIDRKINIMKTEGVSFITGANVGGDVSAQDIMNEYDSVILACGASNPRDIHVNGREADGIYFAVDFLKSTTKALLDNGLTENTYISAKDKNVIVIGGGDTGNDCVGTCVRHGAKSILQLEMMPKLPETRAENNHWPEYPRVCKTDYGQEEAAEVYGSDPRVYQTTVKEFIKDENNNLTGAVLVKLDFSSGKMVQVENSEYTVSADLVLIAAGFLGGESYIHEAFGVDTDSRSNILTEKGSHRTSKEKVYTAGDVHIGQSLVVRAICEGRDCAREVDFDLMGYTNL